MRQVLILAHTLGAPAINIVNSIHWHLSRRNARIVQIHSLQAGLRQFYQCRTLGGLLKEIQHKICSSERADQSALARITGLPKYGEWRIRVVETPRSQSHGRVRSPAHG